MQTKYTWYDYGWVIGLTVNLVGHFVRIFLNPQIGMVTLIAGYALLCLSVGLISFRSYRRSGKLSFVYIVWILSLVLSPVMFSLATSGHFSISAVMLVALVSSGLLAL